MGSGTILINPHGEASQVLSYMPFGEELLNVTDQTYSTPYRFTGHEKDEESGLHYAHARYLSTDLSSFLSVDPMYMKYSALTPYGYCGNNPVARVNPSVKVREDSEENAKLDNSMIKVYIFYDSKSFKGQSMKMYKDAEAKYGKGSVAMSDVTTETEFAQDWNDMASSDIKEVNLNYHGNNDEKI